MTKKVKKINAKEKKAKNPNGFKFGRNLGSLLIVVGGLIVLFFAIFIPYSYISTSNKGNVTPYEGEGAPEGIVLEDVKRMKASEFDLFNVDFYCKTYDVEANKATFNLSLGWNENTSELCTNFKPFANAQGNNLRAYVCLSADWVGFNAYNSSALNYTFTSDKGVVNRTVSVTGIKDFPQKANTWPVKVTVDAPTAYLYLYFSYEKDGKTYATPYILEYEYSDYHTTNTIGAIPA